MTVVPVRGGVQDSLADLRLLATRCVLGDGRDLVTEDRRRAGEGHCRVPVHGDTAGHECGDDVGRAWRAGLQRAVGATAHAGAAGLAELGDRHTLTIGCRVGDLPCHRPLAETGVSGDGGVAEVVEDVGGEERLGSLVDLEAADE